MASDGPLPTDPSTAWGLLAVLLAFAALAGKALDVPLRWFLTVIGWHQKRTKAQEDALVQELKIHAENAVETAMSPIRQHVAEMQRGLEGKQAVLDTRLAEFYREMRDRDEKMTETLHQRITNDLDNHQRSMMTHINGQIEQLSKHVSDLVHVALNGRSTRPRQ
jgi:hypothetical protein